MTAGLVSVECAPRYRWGGNEVHFTECFFDKKPVGLGQKRTQKLQNLHAEQKLDVQHEHYSKNILIWVGPKLTVKNSSLEFSALFTDSINSGLIFLLIFN